MTTLSIETTNAHMAERYDETENANWKIVARGTDCRELLSYLIEGLNNEDISITNNWLRLVEEVPDGTKNITNF